MLTLFFGGMGLIFGIICILAKIFQKITLVPEKLFMIVAWGMYIIAGISLFENLFSAIMGV